MEVAMKIIVGISAYIALIILIGHCINRGGRYDKLFENEDIPWKGE